MKLCVNEHSWLLLSLRIGKVFSCRGQRTLRNWMVCITTHNSPNCGKMNIPPSRRVDLEENRFKGAMEKKQTKKRGGIWCVLLKIALPYVADNKKKFTNKSAISLQSVCYYQRNKEQGVLGNRLHCASDNKKIDWLLNGTSTADFQIIIRLFQLVQSFVFSFAFL